MTSPVGSGPRRLDGLDVARAVALAGVVVMNWTVFFNQWSWSTEGHATGPDWAVRLFDPYQGVLTTRFAATFVTIAGIGVTLLARRVGGRAGLDGVRWTLRRRGLALFVIGAVFSWAWPGEILHFVGCYLVVGSFLLRLRPRHLLVAAGLVVAATLALRMWIDHLLRTSAEAASWWWLFEPDLGRPKGLVADLFVSGTHPLLPWLAFFFVGMALGHADLERPVVQRRMIGAGIALVAVGYGASTLATRLYDGVWQFTLRTTPLAPGPLYVLVTAGSSVAGIGAVLAVVRRWPHAWLTARLALAGRMTLTLYLAHGLLAAAVVRWWYPQPQVGLLPSVALAVGFWAVAVTAGAVVVGRLGMGPAERVVRRLGGESAARRLSRAPGTLRRAPGRPGGG